MDQRVHELAAIANRVAYGTETTQSYLDGAPHLKHAELRRLYGELVCEVFDEVRRYSDDPLVLDLGAGEGSVTLPFLHLGARVVAVDVSSSQLATLEQRCSEHATRLEVHCSDVAAVLSNTSRKFDVIVANSFLHHVPDYLGLVRQATTLLQPGGIFFSFQDPIRYDTLTLRDRVLSDLGYLSWRLFKGDLFGGFARRVRRAAGKYSEESLEDTVEYHVVRNGVDQRAIVTLFEDIGCECRVVPYFTSHGRLFQTLGSRLGSVNTFGVIAHAPRA